MSLGAGSDTLACINKKKNNLSPETLEMKGARPSTHIIYYTCITFSHVSPSLSVNLSFSFLISAFNIRTPRPSIPRF